MTTKTTTAKDGRVLPVLQRDYKSMYELGQARIAQLELQVRKLRSQLESVPVFGFGGATRSTKKPKIKRKPVKTK